MQLLVRSIVRDVAQMPTGRFEWSDLKNVRRLWQSLAKSNQGGSVSFFGQMQKNTFSLCKRSISLPCLYHPEKGTNGI